LAGHKFGDFGLPRYTINFTVILKFMGQFNFAKCQKIKCQETSKGMRFSVAKKRIIDDFSKRQIDFCIL
jgi:hypothetical protein